MTLEDMLNRQILARRNRIIEALTEDESAVISVKRLGDAMGVPWQQLQNAAWSGTLPFAFAFYGEKAKANRSTRVYKDKFWYWYNNVSGTEFERQVAQ